MSSEIKIILSKLNSAQLQAVESTEGPVIVTAGPGTGKTQLLAARIAYLLATTDTQPGSILSFSFTEAAAANLRKRVVEVIGPIGYQLSVHTFHSFAQQIITEYPEVFSFDHTQPPLDEASKLGLVVQGLNTLKLEILRPLNKPDLYVRECLHKISELKREAISPTELKEQAKSQLDLLDQEQLTVTQLTKLQRPLTKLLELAQIYDWYQQQLKQSQVYDFDDMILATLQALDENDWLRLELQEQYQYVQIDEFQDTNSAQLELITQLASYWGEQANIMVVGDPNQSIFRFQGASAANFASFKDLFPTANQITLTESYRCPQAVLELAGQVLPSPPVALRTHNPATSAISLVELPSSSAEEVWLVDQINQLTNQYQPEEIAVLVRTNAQVKQWSQLLIDRGIPTNTSGSDNSLDTPLVKQFLDLVEVILTLDQPRSDLLWRVLHFPWFGQERFDQEKILQLGQLCGKLRLPLTSVLNQPHQWILKQDASHQFATPLDWEPFSQLWKQLLNWHQQAHTTPAYSWLSQLLTEQAISDYIKSSDTLSTSLASVTSLLSFSRGYSSTFEWWQQLNQLRAYNLNLPPQPLIHFQVGVVVSTIHKAKGQEWPVVLVPELTDQRWGRNTARQLIRLPAGLVSEHTENTSAEEQRLLYVALTRAKNQLKLSYSTSTRQGFQDKTILITRYLPPTLIPEKPVVTTATQLDQLASLTYQHHSGTKQFWQELTDQFVWSHSALTTFLRDPQLFADNYLLRLPQPPDPLFAYGSALHAAMETWGKQYRAEHQNLSEIIQVFSHKITRAQLEPTEEQLRLVKGKTVLTKLFKSYQFPRPIVQLEYFIGTPQRPIVVEGVKINGRIDRLDKLDSPNQVLVVDYKSGRAKSSDHLLGKTQTSLQYSSQREQSLPESIRSSYTRQLAFYKLLLDNQVAKNWIVSSGSFVFLEPNNKEQATERLIEITDQSVTDLLQLLKVVDAELKSLQFLQPAQ